LLRLSGKDGEVLLQSDFSWPDRLRELLSPAIAALAENQARTAADWLTEPEMPATASDDEAQSSTPRSTPPQVNPVGQLPRIQESLFDTTTERWGWEYVFHPPRPSPLLNKEPQWKEPAPPDQKALNDRMKVANSAQASKNEDFWIRCLVIGVLLVLFGSPIALSLSDQGVRNIALLLAGVGGFGTYMIWNERTKATSEVDLTKKRWADQRNRERAEYQQRLASWRAEIARHDEAERIRVQSCDRWYPVSPKYVSARVDVFGGTRSSWASLLTTLGTSLLASGKSVSLLDFSENDVWFDLERLAAQQGLPVHRIALPEDLARVDLFRGFDATAVVDIVVQAIHSLREQRHERRGLQSLDAHLLRTVVDAIDRPYSVGRLSAGVRFFLRHYNQDREAILSEEELARLDEAMDYVNMPEIERERLGVIRVELDLLETMGAAGSHKLAELPIATGLQVVTTAGSHQSQKEFIEAVLFQALRYGLRGKQSTSPSQQVLIVAGADDLGLKGLEGMSKQAAKAGIRLIYLFEHLREDVKQLLGGGDASAVVMRVGNELEASDAATFIGKHHSFKLSEITRGVGRTFTEGGSTSDSEQEGGSLSGGGYPVGRLFGPEKGKVKKDQWYRHYTESESTSWSKSWSKTKNVSEALAEEEGAGIQRVYEFLLEPTELQSLAPTAFFLIEHLAQRPRVVLADCNPGILSLERVSACSHEPRQAKG
jgi:hypothetical protein